MAFSPNGDRLVSASFDGTICIWCATSHVQELQTRAYSDIRAILLSTDKSMIICVLKIGTVRMMDACMGHHDAVTQPSTYDWRWADFSPDSNEIICVSTNGHSRLIDCQTGKVTQYTYKSREITKVVFSSTKTHFASISKCNTIDFSEWPSHGSNSNTQFTSSSDGRWIISEHKLDNSTGRVCMWDLRSRQCIWESLEESYGFPYLLFSHSGNMVLSKRSPLSRYISWARETASGAIITGSHRETVGGWDSEPPTPLDEPSGSDRLGLQKTIVDYASFMPLQGLYCTEWNTIPATKGFHSRSI